MLRLLGLTGLLVATAMGGPVAAVSATPPLVRALQPTVALLASHVTYEAPRTTSSRIGTVAAHRPITLERTVLPVLGQATDARGTGWLRVRLPGRPNGTTGWIRRAATIEKTTSMHLVVELAQRRVIAYRSGRAVRTFAAIVGKASTPTPTGEFFVEESVALPPNQVGAPFALALSARSEVLAEFDGGPGQIALHGLANVGGSLGTAASHGCIRLPTAAITWLVEQFGPGDPVTIR